MRWKRVRSWRLRRAAEPETSAAIARAAGSGNRGGGSVGNAGAAGRRVPRTRIRTDADLIAVLSS
jgi:hypothetical protein